MTLFSRKQCKWIFYLPLHHLFDDRKIGFREQSKYGYEQKQDVSETFGRQLLLGEM